MEILELTSKHGNCISFEVDQTPPIVSLKWSKNRSPLIANDSVKTDDEEFVNAHLIAPSNSENKENILAYIGGYIIRMLITNLSAASVVKQ